MAFGLWKWRFFADRRLRAVGMGCGGWKRVTLDSNKERFGQKQGFWFVKMGGFWNQQGKACANEGLLYIKGQFLRTVFKLSVNRKLLVCENGNFCGQRRKARAKEVFVRKKRLWVKFVKFLLMKFILIRDKGVFFAHAKLSDKEKIFSAHNDTDFAPHQS